MSDPKELYLTQARELVESLESGNDAEVERLLDHLGRRREEHLFQELGKMTRELHEALNNFQLDNRITDITESDIPDAKERLNYVITMTEEAAHRTLGLVEEALPISDVLKDNANRLHAQWMRFRSKDMSVEEFRELSRELDGFLNQTVGHAGDINGKLNEVMMAQDYQDLTGQIIRRVINLVQEVEDKLVGLIRISGQERLSRPADEDAEKDRMMRGLGPQVPGGGSVDVVSGQDDVDDLLSSLGF
ncbi:MAG: protein phosphatase CheZ [Xanthomonadaceae bacterium]|nr:protein phosphatase CheZ [Xanthomonadaceae bacterium]